MPRAMCKLFTVAVAAFVAVAVSPLHAKPGIEPLFTRTTADVVRITARVG